MAHDVVAVEAVHGVGRSDDRLGEITHRVATGRAAGFVAGVRVTVQGEICPGASWIRSISTSPSNTLISQSSGGTCLVMSARVSTDFAWPISSCGISRSMSCVGDGPSRV